MCIGLQLVLLMSSLSWSSFLISNTRFCSAVLTWSLCGILLSVKNTWDELRILFSQEKVLALLGKYSCPLQAMLPSSCLTSQHPHQIHSTIQYCSQICHPSRNLALESPSHFAWLRDFNSFKRNSEGKQFTSQKTGAVMQQIWPEQWEKCAKREVSRHCTGLTKSCCVGEFKCMKLPYSGFIKSHIVWLLVAFLGFGFPGFWAERALLQCCHLSSF